MKLRFSLLFVFAMMLLPINEACAKSPKYDGTRIVAHRGFWNCEEAGYAKNSIASLKCAQQADVWGSEFEAALQTEISRLRSIRTVSGSRSSMTIRHVSSQRNSARQARARQLRSTSISRWQTSLRSSQNIQYRLV